MPRALLVGAAAALLLAVPTIGTAGPAGTWTRLHTGNGSVAEPGLARTGDGVLHIAWQRTAAGRDDIVQQAIAPSGTATGSATVVTQGWQSINPHIELVAAGAELRALWAGTPASVPGPVVSAVATGSAWSAPTAVTTSATAASAAGIGAALGAALIVAQGDATAGTNLVRVGSGPELRYESAGCCAYDPQIGIDGVSGDAVIAWYSTVPGRGGLWTQGVGGGGLVGARAAVPGAANGSGDVPPDQRTAITGRVGAGGVYLAYGAAGNVDLMRVGGSPVVIARGSVSEHVGIAAAPEGRLWVFWSHRDYYLAARSNKAATRFGTATRIALPEKAAPTYGLFGEGSLGPLDLVAHAGTGGAVPDWHTQVLPRLSLVSSVYPFTRNGRKLRRVSLRVYDAGDPVRAAIVTIAGRSLKTDTRGRTTVVLRSTGKQVDARATKQDYAPAKTRVRL